MGQWVNGKKHGKGVLTLQDGSEYTGLWKEGVIVFADWETEQ